MIKELSKELRKKDLEQIIERLQLELNHAHQLIKELNSKLKASEERVSSLESLNKSQQDIIAQLQKRLNIDSSNSSQPSS